MIVTHHFDHPRRGTVDGPRDPPYLTGADLGVPVIFRPPSPARITTVGPGYRPRMADQSSHPRALVVALVVLGVIVVGLGAFLIIGAVQGDDTENIDPQNGQVVTLVR